MTYKEFYAQALLEALPIAYDVAKATSDSGLPNPEIIAQDAALLAQALSMVLAETVGSLANREEPI
ncbi:MAG: hypothetical protein JO069_11030 [Verrucomicrobia bacterium]|nr:hypothetical protein [Verrucomicrobiota bacterium]